MSRDRGGDAAFLGSDLAGQVGIQRLQGEGLVQPGFEPGLGIDDIDRLPIECDLQVAQAVLDGLEETVEKAESGSDGVTE